jgi:tetratricopeptide (TPR) repeat protein
VALDASRKVAGKVPDDYRQDQWALYQSFLSMPLYTMMRFGMWDEILEEPQPPADTRYWTGIWHYARGMAYARTGRSKQAKRELKALNAIAAEPNLSEELVGFAGSVRLLDIAGEILTGVLQAEAGRYDKAIGNLERAIRIEDGLPYTEPPDWYYPVRHTLGAILLEADRPDEAEVIFWQDLKRYPENGYSLYGLWQSLEAQDRAEEAAEIEARFRRAWAESDVRLKSSRF